MLKEKTSGEVFAPRCFGDRPSHPRRITILDNGLRSAGEHSYAIIQGLRRELREMNVAIYAYRGVDDTISGELDCVPHFAHLLYDSLPSPKAQAFRRQLSDRLPFVPVRSRPSERETARVFNASFASDLAALPSDTWAEGNLVLFPGLMQHQIAGLGRFVRSTSVPAKIVCQLMFEPNWLPWGRRSRLGDRLYREAFEALHFQTGNSIVFATENRAMSNLYRNRFGLEKVSLLPAPLIGSRQRPHDGAANIGFFGYSKMEKGFHLLPQAIDTCLRARPDLHFVVQVQHHRQEPTIIEAEQRLRSMKGVRIVDGTLDDARFAAETSLIDIMLLPYDPKRFGMRGSGLFVESVTAGRVVVASAATAAGRSIALCDAVGSTFERYTSAALAAAILKECAHLSARRAAAMAKADGFLTTHTIGSYVAHLFAAAGFAAPTGRSWL